MGLINTLVCHKLHSVPAGFLLVEAIREMRDKSISCIFIVEGEKVTGIITERDLVRIIAKGIDINKITVKKVMTSEVVYLNNQSTLDEALMLMDSKKIRHLLITDDQGESLGVITHTDIIRKLEEDFFKAPRPVSEYMSTNIEFLSPQDTLMSAIQIMHNKKISSIVIADGQMPVGILTERDVVKLLQEGTSMELSIQQFMSAPIIKVEPNLSLYDASRLMEKHRIRHLLIWNGEKIVGLITNTDVVKSIRDNYRTYLEKEAIRTRKILDLIHEGVIEISSDGYTIEWINQTGAEMLNFKSVHSAVGHNFLDLIEEQDRKIIEKDIQEFQSKKNYQCRIHSGNKTLIMLITYDVTMDDLRGRHSYRVLLRDITSVVENRMSMEESLRRQKTQFQALFDNTTDAVVIFDIEKRIQLANTQFLEMFGYTYEEVKNRNITEVVDPFYKLEDHIAENVFRGKTANRETYRYTKAGRLISVLLKGGPVIVDSVVTGGYAVYSDITERREMMKDLRDSEEKYRTLIETMGEGMSFHELVYDEYNNVVDYRFLDVNPAFEKQTGVPKSRVYNRLASEIFKTDKPPYIKEIAKANKSRKPIKIEGYFDYLDKHLRMSIFSPKEGYFATLFEDITEQKRKEEQIKYLIYHDMLTGVNNRNYFEKQLKQLDVSSNLPISIIMADLNGLKLVNDAFGHDKGDELIKMAADAIKSVCRDGDVAARIGGDEFGIILPKTSKEVASQILDQLREKCNKLEVEGIASSASFGLAVKDTITTNIFEIIKLSEVQMYNRKLMESQSAKNHLITSLLSVMEEKTGETKEHCQKVMHLGVKLGEKVGLTSDEIEKLRVLALLHDIGHITIPEHILKKPSALTEEEWEIIKKHPESGYRIVSSIPEFAFVSEYILCHHERIDGNGYPRGLSGDSIPIIARVLAVVDAYEVMTRDTTYSKALSKQEAIQELERNAGTQFDKRIVSIFIDSLMETSNKR